jgi:hypothetical protein
MNGRGRRRVGRRHQFCSNHSSQSTPACSPPPPPPPSLARPGLASHSHLGTSGAQACQRHSRSPWSDPLEGIEPLHGSTLTWAGLDWTGRAPTATMEAAEGEERVRRTVQ